MTGIVLYPFFIISFHVLFLFFHNASILELRLLIAPLIAANLFVSSVLLLLSFLIKNRQKAGLITCILILLLLYYGHLWKLIAKLGIYSHGFSVPFYFAIFLIVSFLIVKSRWKLAELTRFLNICAVFLVLTPLITGISEVSMNWFKPDTGNAMKGDYADGGGTRPHIFHIVLDAYAREDILKEYYNHDNADFLDTLRSYGFQVAQNSTANYIQTHLSLASTLNFSYLDFLVRDLEKKNLVHTDYRKPLYYLINNSRVILMLKRLGYKIISFDSGLSGTDRIESADTVLAPGKSAMNEFYYLLIRDTLFSVIPMSEVSNEAGILHRRRVLYVLDELPNLAKSREPRFVFAHIISPHPPFVFDEDGGKHGPGGRGFGMGFGDDDEIFPDKDEYRRNYLKQLRFINKKVTETVRRILSESPSPPIIILQSDHGPASMLNWKETPGCDTLKERFGNLLAVYMPDAGETVYDSMTPVNTFSLVFNRYFGTDFEQMEDRNYYSTWKKPYIFNDVTEQIKYSCSSAKGPVNTQ